jgi:PIN domain
LTQTRRSPEKPGRFTKLELDTVEALQPLGSNVTYVQSDRRAKNAVDFHIAFHLSRLLEEHLGNDARESNRARFIIVTKDGGFDAVRRRRQPCRTSSPPWSKRVSSRSDKQIEYAVSPE